MCGGILLLQPFLLPKAGDGIAGRKLGVLHDGLLPIEIRVDLCRRLLRFCYIPPGFQLAIRTRLVEAAAAIAHGLLNLPFSQVAGLNTGILALHLAHLAVEGRPYFLHRPG